MKINIGCGRALKWGWINADNTVKEKTKIWQKEQRKEGYTIIDLDATKPWPYDDEVFDYVMSEHMIEHVSKKDGLFLLREAFRTLKPNGVIRIACPELVRFQKLRGQDDHPYVKLYYKQIFNRAVPRGGGARVSKAVLNENGHLWVPSTQQLIDQIKNAGFKNVKEVEYGVSEHEELNGVEVLTGKHSDLRKWDTVSVEGTKHAS